VNVGRPDGRWAMVFENGIHGARDFCVAGQVVARAAAEHAAAGDHPGTVSALCKRLRRLAGAPSQGASSAAIDSHGH
jgi:hypothetical protein